LAATARKLFERYEVVMLGTNRSASYPRLSLVEPVVFGDELVIGTRANDVKTGDLRRDPRCSIHTLVSHRTHDEGEFKAYLVAAEIESSDRDDVLAKLSRPEMNWSPTAAFALRVNSASLVRSGATTRWPEGG